MQLFCLRCAILNRQEVFIHIFQSEIEKGREERDIDFAMDFYLLLICFFNDSCPASGTG